MSKQEVTVFVCTGKDCCRAWGRVTDDSPARWLKDQTKAAGLPIKLNVVKTNCMDRCDESACVCCVAGGRSSFHSAITSPRDAERLLDALAAMSGVPQAETARSRG